MIKADKIYFDMDGVLADFKGGVRDLCGIAPSLQGQTYVDGSDAYMWEKIRQVDHFYARLKVLPGAIKMFETVVRANPGKCQILTGVPKPDKGIRYASEDKEEWIRRYFSKSIPVNIVLRKDKILFCKGKGSILIDDFSANIKAWEKAGGTGICHKDPERTLRELERMGVL